MRTVLAVLACLLLIGAGTATVLAGQYENERDGFVIGFNVGGGGAKFEQDDPPIESDSTGGVAAAFRLGWAFADEFMLGIDGHAWRKEENGVDLTGTTSLICFTWYPSARGFFLRTGFGVGNVEFGLETTEGRLSVDDDGGAFGIGAGHEWRLASKFALGAAVDYNVIDLDGWKLKYFNVTAQFNWYF
jgi:hypothetical protein